MTPAKKRAAYAMAYAAEGEEVLPEPCPYCGGQAVLTHHDSIYGKAYGKWPFAFVCSCGARCGLHPWTLRPLGRLADAGLRAAKKAAHGAFDPAWKDGHVKRSAAYMKLADHLGIDPSDCHIGLMDTETCLRVVAICTPGWWEIDTRKEQE